ILFQISDVTLTSIVRNRAANGAEGHCGLPFTVGGEAALDRRKAVFLRDPVVAPGAAAQPAAGVASAADAAAVSPAGAAAVFAAGVAARPDAGVAAASPADAAAVFAADASARPTPLLLPPSPPH